MLNNLMYVVIGLAVGVFLVVVWYDASPMREVQKRLKRGKDE